MPLSEGSRSAMVTSTFHSVVPRGHLGGESCTSPDDTTDTHMLSPPERRSLAVSGFV